MGRKARIAGILFLLGALGVVLTWSFYGGLREAPSTSQTLPSPVRTPTQSSSPSPAPPTIPTEPLSTLTSPPAFRAEAIRVVAEKPLTRDGRFAGSTFGVAWSPGGDKIAFARVTGQFITSSSGFTSQTSLWIAHLTDTSYRKISDIGQSPAWSPDGTHVAFVAWLAQGRSEVRVFDFASGKTETVVEQGIAVSWLRDKIVVTVKDGRVRAYDLATATAVPITDYTVSVDGPNTLAASLSGEYMALVHHREIWLISPHSPSHAIKLTDRFENTFGSLVWAPTGDRIAYVADKAIWVTTLSPQIHSQRIYIWPERGHPWALTWSPDGNVLAFHGPEGVSLVNADGSGFRTLVPYGVTPEKSYLFPAWSPDGTMMAVEREKNLWLLLLAP